MILYSVGKRIKNFIKVTILSDFKEEKEKIISGEKFLKNNSELKEGKVCWYYDNGKLKSECSYKNNMLEGISTHYYETGQIKAKETYKNNKLNGLSLGYYENGRKKYEETYKLGTLISRISFDFSGVQTVEKSS